MKFKNFSIKSGLLLENKTNEINYSILAFEKSSLKLDIGATYFGIIYKGEVEVVDRYGSFKLRGGMSFVIKEGEVNANTPFNGKGIIIKMEGYNGLRQFCGPIENEGRLKYLDNCSDTLLVSPPKYGDPCLNHLHIPRNITQTPHTHPSDRIGLVMEGFAECITDEGIFLLKPGDIWVIPKNYVHSFNTLKHSIDLITWHPDSEFGPSDKDHPMINRTIVTI